MALIQDFVQAKEKKNNKHRLVFEGGENRRGLIVKCHKDKIIVKVKQDWKRDRGRD